jgi:rare lipoprotein A
MSLNKVLLAVMLSALGLCLFGCSSAAPRFRAKSVDRKPPSTEGAQLRGVASFYADEFNGRRTSNGEVYNMNDLTAAHRELPFNTKVKVRNLDTNRTVIVRINDRGPFKDDRIIDLSLEAAKQLGIIQNGTAPVELEIVEPVATQE